jgi:hypothetical protein
MTAAEVGTFYAVFNTVSMLGTFTVACTAAVVAIVLSMRRQSVAAAWLLVVGWGGAWLVDVGFMGAGFLTGKLDMPYVHGVYLALRFVSLLFGLIAAVGLGLMRPERRALDPEASP